MTSQKVLIDLTEDERFKGFVRKAHQTYTHVGRHPKYPLRDLTPEEQEAFGGYGYTKFEIYPDEDSPVTGRFWTEKELASSGCGTVTKVALEDAEIHARNPRFHRDLHCQHCGKLMVVEEFVWPDGSVVGS